MLGYNKIPDYWKQGLKEAESLNFKYTTLSLNEVYDISLKHALQQITRNGGQVTDKDVTIRVQQPQPVKLEQSFTDHFPTNRTSINKPLTDEYTFSFEGNGFVITGETAKWDSKSDYVFKAELYLDEKLLETVDLPTSFTGRRYEIFWKYKLPTGKHTVKLKLLNPTPEHTCQLGDYITYSDKPTTTALSQYNFKI